MPAKSYKLNLHGKRKEETITFEGEDAVLLRQALHLVNAIGREQLLDDDTRNFLEGRSVSVDDHCLWLRSLFCGTAFELDAQMEALLPPRINQIANFFFNQFFRSFGNMYVSNMIYSLSLISHRPHNPL